ncbi:hypothetical protein C8J34_11649 [Rhizobium sp. PP-F2F-G36]|nr:hypothetical protein C8J34_11649 [Rhizobium sp. PP-F2F-G36]
MGLGFETMFHPVTIAEKVERIRRYLEADRVADLKKAADTLCTIQTLRNLVYSGSEPENSTTVKNGNLNRIISKLPPIEMVLHYEAYRGFLKEMELDDDSQRSLRSFAGSYKVQHDIQDFPVNKIYLKFQAEPFFPVFIFYAKYRTHNRGWANVTHDGFVILSSSTLILFGISNRFVTNFYLERSDDPERIKLVGTGLIFDKLLGKYPSSQFTLTNMQKAAEAQKPAIAGVVDAATS